MTTNPTPVEPMSDSTHWPAPAKLNLFLSVTGRRDDGYHELQTVFQLLDIGDELDFKLSSHGAVTRTNDLSGVKERDDLVIRAANLLREETGYGGGVEITMRKHLPMGGGLGGGSSDAATVLVALNALWRTGLSVDELAALGLRLGADVPVFVRGSSAWGGGVGEKIQPLELGEQWYFIIHPNCHVSTAEVFNDPALTRNSPAKTIRSFLRAGHVGNVVDFDRLMCRTHNDCESVVARRFAQVAGALRWLSEFRPARLTGTGACVFTPVQSAEEGRSLHSRMPGQWQGFVARGCDHSMLKTRLEQLSR